MLNKDLADTQAKVLKLQSQLDALGSVEDELKAAKLQVCNYADAIVPGLKAELGSVRDEKVPELEE